MTEGRRKRGTASTSGYQRRTGFQQPPAFCAAEETAFCLLLDSASSSSTDPTWIIVLSLVLLFTPLFFPGCKVYADTFRSKSSYSRSFLSSRGSTVILYFTLDARIFFSKPTKNDRSLFGWYCYLFSVSLISHFEHDKAKIGV